jgi:hypothetical protein
LSFESDDTSMESDDANFESDDTNMESEDTGVCSEDADEESEDTVQAEDDAPGSEEVLRSAVERGTGELPVHRLRIGVTGVIGTSEATFFLPAVAVVEGCTMELESVIKIECCVETWSEDLPDDARLGMSEAGGYNTCSMSELLWQAGLNTNRIRSDVIVCPFAQSPLPFHFDFKRCG